LIEAVREFIKIESRGDPPPIRKNAERFGVERFKKEFRELSGYVKL